MDYGWLFQRVADITLTDEFSSFWASFLTQVEKKINLTVQAVSAGCSGQIYCSLHYAYQQKRKLSIR
jgi:hypothetical protein